MFRDVTRCYVMVRDVMRCDEMARHGSICGEMVRDVTRCYTMVRDETEGSVIVNVPCDVILYNGICEVYNVILLLLCNNML